MDKRLKNKTLTPDLLDLFYQVLILCESDAINTIKLRITDPRLKEFLNDKDKKREKGKVVLTYNAKSRKNGINNIEFNTPIEINEIRFTNTKNNVIKSLLWHLRHAFAHNRLYYDNAHKFINVENVYNGVTKMKAKVRAADLKKLVKFLITIENNN